MILANDEDQSHEMAINEFLSSSERALFVVAFLKRSGLDLMKGAIFKFLERHKRIDFVVGTDLYITEPDALKELRRWSRKYNVTSTIVYKNVYTFHPKVYVFYEKTHCTIIAGSANLTAGGMANNYEASIVLERAEYGEATKIEKMIDDLRVLEEARELTDAIITEYERAYKIFRSLSAVASSKARRLIQSEAPSLEILQSRLAEMKRESGFHGFEYQQTHRQKRFDEARGNLEKLLRSGDSASRFHILYKDFIQKWSSTGNIRSSEKVIKNHTNMIEVLRELVDRIPDRKFNPYQYMIDKSPDMPGMGINAITEILHCLSPNQFAVLNANSAHGISFSSNIVLPKTLTKNNISEKKYREFCEEVERIREALGLQSFLELDALFSYIYFTNEQ